LETEFRGLTAAKEDGKLALTVTKMSRTTTVHLHTHEAIALARAILNEFEPTSASQPKAAE
jgi:hypothetical protein